MIARLEYVWVEGEQDACFIIHPKRTREQFEDDLRTIRDTIIKNIDSYKDGEYGFIKCTPSFYELIQTYLKDYGYIIESIYPDVYDVDYDGFIGVNLTKKKEIVKWATL